MLFKPAYDNIDAETLQVMDGLRIGDVARPLTPLTPEDTVGRAAERLRSVPYDKVPVVAAGHLVGVVTEEALGSAARAVLDGVAAPEQVRLLPLDNGLLRPVAALAADGGLADAAAAIHRAKGALPVVDREGRYIGMLAESDLADAVCRAQRPLSIGGMATPLGVYLTTGTLSAGARGSLGLFLTGVSVAALFLVAGVLTGFVMQGLEWATGIPMRAAVHSTPVSWLNLNRYDIWPHVVSLLNLLMWVVLFRLSPLTGTHAAEHQVVHAVEQDRPLTPENVARMPRAHPRCGTRLFAIVLLVLISIDVLPLSDGLGPLMLGSTAQYLIAVVAVLLWWRTLSRQIQERVTTKPASQKQLRNAIAVAEELLARHREQPPRRLSLWGRIWHMGILQVVSGSSLVYAVVFPWVERRGLLW